MLADFIRHKVMLVHLFLHGRGLPSVSQGGVLNFLAPFRFSDNIKRIVHVAFESVHHTRIFLELPAPVIHRLQACIGQTGGQSQFQHFDTRSQFHDQPFIFYRILRRGHAVLHDHAFTGEPLLMPRSTHDLPQGFLHIIVVMFKILLTRHIDRIFVRLVMRNSATVRAHGNEVVPHLQ